MNPTPNAPAAVLFDCDGVLIDTEITSANVLTRKLNQLGVHAKEEELRHTIKGTSLEFVEEEATRRFGKALPPKFFAQFIEARLKAYRQGVEQIPGAADAVRAVQAAGIPIAVVSQGAHSKMAVTLPASGMDEVLGDAPVFSGDDVENGKPHPDLYLLAAEKLGVDPAQCVVIEDSPTGAEGAVAAGMRVLGFSADADPELMAEAGAEVFHDMSEVAWRIGIVTSPTGS